ncbi:hypothetical protein ES692_04820 [Psychroserpens burtonensis]|uniref:TerB family tellurite resistance protein n=1 Tax=Psychroserpens burtonensis TaxID=49278 RepID=A0A5C7B962_9FLAO|nr:hypothetical protein [Psychroserpens burtonensis]TXE18778.1 hypothetical protein ES692_04820 [Psychroserpens burtonensis]
MKNKMANWSKADLKIYILLLCAKIDNEESEEEIALIKSKTDEATFNKLYNEFCCDEENGCFEKIEDAVNHHEYAPKELDELKQEILDVFHSDKKFVMKERYLEKVFNNILY